MPVMPLTRLRHLLLGAGLACAGAASLPASGAAQDFPSILPMRDAALLYQVTSPSSAPMRVQAWVSATDQKLRLQEDGKPDYLILDRGAEQVMLVAPEKGMVFVVATEGLLHRALDPSSNLHFSRAGTRNVAGYDCTVWRIEGPRGGGDGCVTRDGLILSAQGRGNGPDSQGHVQSGEIVAQSVRYAPQSPEYFEAPSDLQQITLPAKLLQSMLPSLMGSMAP